MAEILQTTLIFLLAVAMATCQRCDFGTSYVCLGNNFLLNCINDQHMDCAMSLDGDTNTLCIPDLDIDSACQPRPSCPSEGKFALQGHRCNKFYECTKLDDRTGNDAEYSFSLKVCSAGYEYSSRDEKCMPAALAGCSEPYPETTTTTTTTMSPTPPLCVVGKSYVDESSCNSYRYCTSQVTLTKRYCTAPKGRFDLTSETCVENTVCGLRPDRYATTVPPTTSAPCVFGDRLEYAANCYQYRQCNEYQEYTIRNCLFNTVFNTVFKKCVENDGTVCSGRPETPINDEMEEDYVK